MKKLLTAVSVFGLIVVLAVFACNKKDKQSIDRDLDALSNEQIISEVRPVLQDYLNGQYALLTGKSKSTVWQNLQKNPGDDSIFKKILFLKSELLKVDLRYTDFTSKVTIEGLNRIKGAIQLKIADRYSLKTNDWDQEAGEFIITRGEFVYNVSMYYINSSWLISDFFPVAEDPWYINLSPETGSIEDETLHNSDGNLRQEQTAKYTYNSKNAQRYALKYYDNPNTAYCNYSNIGGDCTNFLSQCLKAGGWKHENKWWVTGKGCCTNRRNCGNNPECYSCSWTVAHEFYKYVIRSGRIFSHAYMDRELEIGDILQFDFEPYKSVNHSSIVTKKSGSGKKTKVYVTYRNLGERKAKSNVLSTTIPGIHYGFRVKSKAS